jgi:hypothetical protein
MGLDQYAFTRKAGEKDTQISQWRKHADLEGWMSELYYEKGGTEDVFNCVELTLTKEDLLRLKDEYQNLEQASGFFWGTSGKYEEIQTGDFIKSALEAIDAGYEVIYTSWW